MNRKNINFNDKKKKKKKKQTKKHFYAKIKKNI